MHNEKIYEIYLPYPGREDRQISVYVPEHEDGEKFPVIYMTDGQNLFDAALCRFGCWNIPASLSAEHRLTGRSAIVVGIHNPEPWRTNELMPASVGEIQCPDEVRPFIAPSGEIFDNFVTETLIPEIEKRFPVKTGRENTAFCGSSSGGLQSFFIAMSHPDIFAMAGVFSPAFEIYRPEDFCKWTKSMIKNDMPYLYIYSGGSEGVEVSICRSTIYICDFMERLYPLGKLKRDIRPELPHNEGSWEVIFKEFLHIFLNDIAISD